MVSTKFTVGFSAAAAFLALGISADAAAELYPEPNQVSDLLCLFLVAWCNVASSLK